MTGGVLHDQRLLRDEMPQVVHDDRGHPAHRLELMRLGETLGRLLEGEEARHLAAGGAQQIDLLPGQRRSPRADARWPRSRSATPRK